MEYLKLDERQLSSHISKLKNDSSPLIPQTQERSFSSHISNSKTATHLAYHELEERQISSHASNSSRKSKCISSHMTYVQLKYFIDYLTGN
jgi:hypothetical protein